jgi:hypothetical protein
VIRDELRALQGPLKERYPATGGDGSLLCSGDMLLEALVETDADEEQLAVLQKLTERYCVVYQTLASGPALSTTLINR